MKLFFFLAIIIFINAQQRIHLRDVQALTFQKGMYTTSRRTSPYPQLKKVGGEVTNSYEPSTVQCKNVGFDGAKVNWKCEADMDKKYKFGSIEVVCEGYEMPGDQYVLVGSCGLEYTLDYTARGRNRNQNRNQGYQRNTPRYVDNSSNFATFLFWFIILLVIIGICLFLSSNKNIHASGVSGPGFQPIYPQNTYGSGYPTTTIINTDSGYSSGFYTGLNVGSMNNRSNDYNNNNYSAPTRNDDDDSTRTATGYGGTRTR